MSFASLGGQLMVTFTVERMCQSLDENGQVRAVALNILKTSESFYYTGLVHKLNRSGISRRSFNLIHS